MFICILRFDVEYVNLVIYSFWKLLVVDMYLNYSKTCLKQPIKNKTENWFSIPIIA